MPKRPYGLPPLNTLVSFEAAARNVSFKAAAKELNVTPAAISHQVKALEQELRCPLFNRFHRGVELTESGAYLLVALQRGFEGIEEAVDQLRAQRGRAMVTIRSTTAVSSLWLTPRLAQFWKSHGHISVAQLVSDLEISGSDCDISIHYGDMTKETGTCRALFHDKIMALGSPQFAAKHNLKTVEDLVKVPLIQLDAHVNSWTEWEDWCHALGYTGEVKLAHRVNNYIIALQAARDDMGAVLGWEGLTQELVSSGKLVKLIPDTVSTPLDFYVKLHNQSSARAGLVFRWLTEKEHQTA